MRKTSGRKSSGKLTRDSLIPTFTFAIFVFKNKMMVYQQIVKV